MTQTNPEQWAVELWRKALAAYHGPTYVSPERAGEVIQAAFAEREARLVGALVQAIAGIEYGDRLDDQLCCSGDECGCQGSTHRQLLLHDLHSAFAAPKDRA